MFKFWIKNKKLISADSAASTPLDRRVALAMARAEARTVGNPSSIHRQGVLASRELEKARLLVAKSLKAEPDEIIFTSGGTESNNLAILGASTAWAKKNQQPGRVVTVATEHKSVLAPIQSLGEKGWVVDILPVDTHGRVDVKKIDVKLLADTVLISVSFANNEIGTLHQIREIAKLVRLARKTTQSAYPLFHVDACQAPRFFDLDVRKLGADLLTLNSSKIYGPKGSGILYKTRATEILPILRGGGQEQGLRSGTPNVLGAVGLAEALTICGEKAIKENEKLAGLRDLFVVLAKKELPGVVFHGDLAERLPNNLNFTLSGVDAEWAVLWLDSQGIEASTGSACSNNFTTNNHVLEALYGKEAPKEGSIRLSFGRAVQEKDVRQIIQTLKEMPRSSV